MIKFASVFAIAALAATAAQAQSLQQQMARCLAVTGALQRLACYDAAARDAGLSAPRGPAPAYAPPSPAYAAPAPQYAPPVQQAFAPAPAPSGMGSERLPSTVTRETAKSLTAGVAGISFDPYGRFTMTLDNGQVWRQLPGDQSLLNDTHPRQVRVTHGALGSYDIQVIGRNASYRVTRLQ